MNLKKAVVRHFGFDLVVISLRGVSFGLVVTNLRGVVLLHSPIFRRGEAGWW